MNDGEMPEMAVLREVLEEIGTSQVCILGLLPRRTRYVWSGGPAKTPFDGQAHIWFVLRLDGTIEEENSSEEFSAFDWIAPTEILSRTHPVRRGTYHEVQSMLIEWLSEHSPEPNA